MDTYYRDKETHWMLEQLPDDLIDYCETKARELVALELPGINDNSLASWLHVVVSEVYNGWERHCGLFCAEMGEG